MRSEPKGESHSVQADIPVKLVPRASVDKVVGRERDFIKVKVTAPPVEGKANSALVELLAKKLKVPKGNIQIISGERSRVKRVRIQGISETDAYRILQAET